MARLETAEQLGQVEGWAVVDGESAGLAGVLGGRRGRRRPLLGRMPVRIARRSTPVPTGISMHALVRRRAPGVKGPESFIALEPNDLILLCSDGLARASSDPDLVYLAHRSLDEIADHLLNDALVAGGRDNISFVLIEVGQTC